MDIRRGPIVASFVALALLASCGNSDVLAADGPASTTEPTAKADTQTSTDSTSISVSADDGSPLEQLLGAPINDDAAMQRFYDSLEREAQEATAECMLNQGFQFVPDAPEVRAIEASGLAEDSVEFAERFGFGIAIDFLLNELGGPDARESSLDAHLATLTETERQAFEVALWGEPTDEQDDDGFDQWGGGCFGASYEAAYAKSPDRVFDVLDRELGTILAQYYADPRIVATQSDYAECMATAGYEYETADKARVAIARELADIVSDSASFEDPLPPGERNGIGMGWNEESIEFEIAGNVLTAQAQADVDALAKQESTVALASATCMEPLRPIELEVQFEYEQQLVDQFGDQVRAIQASE